jgi:pimeloyl-[acyl-carrier protein] methyl ester esterase
MRSVTLTGWGQPHDALSVIAPGATHIDYTRHDTVEAALEAIADQGKHAELVIGWSLGGQLAVRAIAAGMLMPRKLVLIGAPFQFVKSPQLALGMPRDAYEKFCENYAKNPERTLDKAWELVVKDDRREAQIRLHLEAHDKSQMLASDWLKWLTLLDGFSCEHLPFAHFPPTLLVHGEKDVVVDAKQAEFFAKAIRASRIDLWADCGHAPHWHDSDRLRQLIGVHVNV